MSSAKKKITPELFLIVSIVIAVIFWVLIPLVIINFYSSSTASSTAIQTSGQLGDTFGIVNSLFTALAFALLIYTALMQRKELSLQRKELRLTREELQLTRDEIKKSAEAQKTLVELTRDQLRIQKAIHKNELIAQLRLEKIEFITKGNSFAFIVTLQVINDGLKIDNIYTNKEYQDVIIDNIELQKKKNIFFNESEYIDLEFLTSVSLIPINLVINIDFENSNGMIRKQQIFFANNTQYITDPRNVTRLR